MSNVDMLHQLNETHAKELMDAGDTRLFKELRELIYYLSINGAKWKINTLRFYYYKDW